MAEREEILGQFLGDESFPVQWDSYLDPVYGQQFADWWHDRLVREMQRNFAYLEDLQFEVEAPAVEGTRQPPTR